MESKRRAFKRSFWKEGLGMRERIIKRGMKLAALAAVMILINDMVVFGLKNTNLSAEVNIRDLYREPEGSIDVAMIGSSEIFADYSPPIAYGRFGFTSYNLGFSRAAGNEYGSMLSEFLRRQDPQLVVIEINGFLYDEGFQKEESVQRLWIDNMDRSLNWIATINDNIPPGERSGYFFRIAKYHSNWKRPARQYSRLKALARNGKGEVSLMKSFATQTVHNVEYEKERSTRCLSDLGRECLTDLIDQCREQGIEKVLFIRAPHLNSIDSSSDQEIGQIVNESGYQYINFDLLIDEIGLDPYHDFYNNEHLNIYGNEKFTEYLGGYIMSSYDIETGHDQRVDALWKECYSYTVDAFEKLKKRTDDDEKGSYWTFSDISKGAARR